MDQKAFILGMVTAFCECVAGGCKRLALSPPLTLPVFEDVREEAESIIEKHGLCHDVEWNLDMPEERRHVWILIAGRKETLAMYHALRDSGYRPWESLEPFYGLLSYREEEAVHTGFDAYRAYFPM